MFGHQNDQENQQDDASASDSFGNDNPGQPAQDSWQNPAPADSSAGAPAADNPAFSPSVGAPADSSDAPQTSLPAPSADAPAPEPSFGDPLSAAAAAADPIDANDLLDIKQHALSQLSPLVGHLDQTPEEKFRTTMMMIQASDNQTLVKEAYEAAQAISDEKARAQALLDVINEINYFTQHQAA